LGVVSKDKNEEIKEAMQWEPELSAKQANL
jgi:hypothetical protein